MNKIMCLIVIYILFINLALADTRIPIQLLKIYDGDTILVKIDNEKFLVRLIGIDCYKTKDINRAYKQAYQNNLKIDKITCKGKESKEYLEKLYKNNKNKPVYLDFKGVDKYKRALGVIYFNKINANEELLNKGGCLKYNYK